MIKTLCIVGGVVATAAVAGAVGLGVHAYRQRKGGCKGKKTAVKKAARKTAKKGSGKSGKKPAAPKKAKSAGSARQKRKPSPKKPVQAPVPQGA